MRGRGADLLLLEGGWFYGITTGLNTKNVFLRRSQFRLAEEEIFRAAVARPAGGGEDSESADDAAAEPCRAKRQTLAGHERDGGAGGARENLEELLGIEGNAARLYFGDFAGMIKLEQNGNAEPAQFHFDFSGRNRRPPRDAGECDALAGV